MQLVSRVVISALLVQTTVVSFQPSQVPRKTVGRLNSLLDEAYDVPSIASQYQKSGAAASDVAKVAKAVNKVSKTKVPSYDTSVGTVTNTPAATDGAAAVKVSAVDDFLNAARETLPDVQDSVTTGLSAAQDSVTTGLSAAQDSVTSGLSAARDNLPAVKSAVSTGFQNFKPVASPLKVTVPEIPPPTQLEPGKVRSLAGYFRESLTSAKSIRGPDAQDLANAKAQIGSLVDNAKGLTDQVVAGSVNVSPDFAEVKSKLALMVSNTYSMIGKEVPQSIQNMPAIDESQAGWVTAGFVTLIALGQGNAGASKAQETMGSLVQKEAAAVSEIAEQLKAMSEEIKNLNEQTAALSRELAASKTKLTEKELALSKEKLKGADKELTLNRSIAKMEVKLREADKKLSFIDKAVKTESDVVASVVEAAAPKPKAKGTPKAVRVVEKAAKAPAKKATKGEKAPAKKATVKKAKTKAVKKTVKKTVKVVKAKAPKAKTVAPKVDTDNWSTLSDSTLTRKTVKQLTEYLSTKGVATTGGDGKALKKAQLVEAVRAL